MIYKTNTFSQDLFFLFVWTLVSTSIPCFIFNGCQRERTWRVKYKITQMCGKLRPPVWVPVHTERWRYRCRGPSQGPCRIDESSTHDSFIIMYTYTMVSPGLSPWSTLLNEVSTPPTFLFNPAGTLSGLCSRRPSSVVVTRSTGLGSSVLLREVTTMMETSPCCSLGWRLRPCHEGEGDSERMVPGESSPGSTFGWPFPQPLQSKHPQVHGSLSVPFPPKRRFFYHLLVWCTVRLLSLDLSLRWDEITLGHKMTLIIWHP